MDGLRCTVQASTTLAAFNHPVLHLGPSFTSPGLPGLTGTGWEYHTFFADPTAGNKRGFLRAVVDSN